MVVFWFFCISLVCVFPVSWSSCFGNNQHFSACCYQVFIKSNHYLIEKYSVTKVAWTSLICVTSLATVQNKGFCKLYKKALFLEEIAQKNKGVFVIRKLTNNFFISIMKFRKTI